MTIPHFVLAAGWIPFVIVLFLSIIFATGYILWFRSVQPASQSCPTTLVCILSLTSTLMTSTLVPVDVFLVSFMKYSNGTYKEWAEDEENRQEIQNTVLDAYYVFYGIILTFAFLVLPMIFFFHVGVPNETDEDSEPDTMGRKLIRSLKYTSVCVLAFSVLIVIGLFVPWGNSDSLSVIATKAHNFTGWERVKFITQDELFTHQKGENLMVFLLNVLNLIGMVLLIFYTGYGMSSLPIGMIKGSRTVHTDRLSVEQQLESVEEQIRNLNNSTGAEQNSLERNLMERLEQQARLLRRTRHDLEQQARSVMNRFILCCRPFQFAFGVMFALFGLLIFISLLLTSIDKAMNSLGPTHGYILKNGTLPNPMDIILVFTQNVFPLDYILYCGIILFFVFCTMSGVKNIGIRFFCLSMYKIRSSGTKPQALVLMCINLIFILLALNVVMFSVVPDYTTYGSQHFIANVTQGNITKHVVEKCNDLESSSTDCNMSRISYLLLAFHAKAWIFGALYYWMVWMFLIVILVGAFVAIYRVRRYHMLEVQEDHEDDEEQLFDNSNPFSAEEAT